MAHSKNVHCVILDTDIGVDIDDDLSILLLLGIIKNYNENNTKSRIKLCGITTVGFLPSFKTLQCQTLLNSLSHHSFIPNIPVFVGSSTNLKNGLFNPFKITNIVFFIFYIYYIIINIINNIFIKTTETNHCDSINVNNSMNGIDALIYYAKLYENTKNKLDIICIGPLSNIGKAIEKDPEFLKRINTITIMGGLLGYTLNNKNKKKLIIDNNHGGSSGFLITDIRDTNLRSDKYSFNHIFLTAKKMKLLHKLILIPLDASLKIYLTPTDCNHISQWIDLCLKYNGNDTRNLILRYIKWSFIAWSYAQIFIWKCDRNLCCSYLHDPLTVIVALLWNNIISTPSDLKLKYNGIQYFVQNNFKKHSLSKSKLLENEDEREQIVNNVGDICHILTEYDVIKMKKYILDNIKSVFC